MNKDLKENVPGRARLCRSRVQAVQPRRALKALKALKASGAACA